MTAMAIAACARMNSRMFLQLSPGSPAQLAGHCAASGSHELILTTTDGGRVAVVHEKQLEVGCGIFVELAGTKGSDGQLCAEQMYVPPASNVDLLLWEEALTLVALPELRGVFSKIV